MRWWNKRHGAERSSGGWLARLARDRTGNTLALMAAAMIPLIGFSGSAVDMARLYVVKVRLQQACDAGVLAARKTMSDTSPSTALDTEAAKQGQAFFANNFRSGWFQNTNAVFTPNKVTQGTSSVANAVAGAATAKVPMALMQFFGAPTVTLSVSCQALYDLADADIVFVLDTTGSMSCYPTDPVDCATSAASYTRADKTIGWRDPERAQTTYNGKPLYSKIESLRQAVVMFDTTMRANADPTTHFRYGFVSYSASVNIGKSIASLSGNYLQNTSWTYDSRRVQGDYNYGSSFSQTINVPQSSCPTGGTVRMPATGYARASDGLWTDEGYYQARVYNNIKYQNGACSGTGQRVRPLWRYEPISWNVSQYVTGAAVANPTRLDGSTTTWRGCIEEVDTDAQSSFDVTSLPDDLDPDFKPSAANNKWRPTWPDAVWVRNSIGGQDVKDEQISEDYGNNLAYALYGYGYDFNYGAGHTADQSGSAACGMPAQRLKTMTAQDVRDYVYNTDFQPFGGTYHDVGMIWGNRLLSPDSVFGDSTPWPGRNDPTRTIVFMTDGNMAPTQLAYGQYGIERYDNRVGSGGDADEQKRRHVARFRIECDAAKKRGFTVYTVAVGLKGTAVPDLDYCSSQGAAYYAEDTQTLSDVFKTIAQRVAKLRISK